ncbi:MAG: YfcE family phosphodiesterase [Ruminococcaceae bacterium]|nr:YfcE family phosphodiesterase [Oscillospiraceae bacterium]
MKILVLSDSHGNVNNMVHCVEMVQPQHVLHLGDCIRDAEELQRLFPDLSMTMVPGNCDWGRTEQGEVLLELGGQRILMMHGHTRSVKHTTMNARYAAMELGADILLFGHTHYSTVDYDGTLYTMNPGSIGDYHAPTYGVITIESGRTDCSVYRL